MSSSVIRPFLIDWKKYEKARTEELVFSDVFKRLNYIGYKPHSLEASSFYVKEFDYWQYLTEIVRVFSEYIFWFLTEEEISSCMKALYGMVPGNQNWEGLSTSFTKLPDGVISPDTVKEIRDQFHKLDREKISQILKNYQWREFLCEFHYGEPLDWFLSKKDEFFAYEINEFIKVTQSNNDLFETILESDQGFWNLPFNYITNTEIFWEYLNFYSGLFAEASEQNFGIYIYDWYS